MRRKIITLEVRLKYPGYRLDWVSSKKAIITSPNGRRYLIPYNPEPWSWERLATWLVPAVLWRWGLWMVCIGVLMMIGG